MCDTMVRVGGSGVLLTKNSERDPDEGQVLTGVPAAEHPQGAQVQSTSASVPQDVDRRGGRVRRRWRARDSAAGMPAAAIMVGQSR